MTYLYHVLLVNICQEKCHLGVSSRPSEFKIVLFLMLIHLKFM